MKESYDQDPASQVGPESCGGGREAVVEALTGERAGRVLSREKHVPLRGADAVEVGGRPYPTCRHREARWDPARSETPRMHGSTAFGNREIPRSPAATSATGRIGKSKDSRR
jgi:RNA-directed DNA polymerase